MAGTFSDAYRLASQLSLKKIINYILLVFSYYLSRILRKPVTFGRPFSVSVEPNNTCNLHCPECPTGMATSHRIKGFIDPVTFEKITSELSPYLVNLILYFQGEPMLNSRFFDLIEIAKRKKIYVMTSTNGHYLTDAHIPLLVSSGLDKLIISLDGFDQESYAAYRKGGDYQKVISGIKKLTTHRNQLKSSHPFIVLQCLVLKTNEHYFSEMKDLAYDLGVDRLEFKSAQFYDFEKGNTLMPSKEKYRRYRLLDNGTYQIKGCLPNHCFRMWTSCVLTWDGKVLPCCFDKDAEYQLGDIKKEPFKEIWKGSLYREFRKSLLANSRQFPMCCNCTEGLGRQEHD